MLLSDIKNHVVSRWNQYRDPNRFPRLGKADIINTLGFANGYKTYLEIASRTTGHKFKYVSGKIFATKHRVLYNVPQDYADGFPIHFSSSDISGTECLAKAIATGNTYDVVFVDPYHCYESSRQNLEFGWDLLSKHGVLIVHDCNPPSSDLVSPEFKEGIWCGETYRAFIDFVKNRPNLAYCVVNTDWGVGLVWRPDQMAPRRLATIRDRPNLNAFDLADWSCFNKHRRAILRLMSTREFIRTFASPEHGDIYDA